MPPNEAMMKYAGDHLSFAEPLEDCFSSDLQRLLATDHPYKQLLRLLPYLLIGSLLFRKALSWRYWRQEMARRGAVAALSGVTAAQFHRVPNARVRHAGRSFSEPARSSAGE